ncbi:MAG: hypothetical protein EHM13_04385 [Acidobacteria bacterium]|nr:MAG: hypothetical protein EHM13_04385 [Acidobacteriota bacterium]
MKTRLRAVALAAVLAAPGLPAQGQAVNPHAQALQEFRERVDEYVKLRDKVRAEMPKLEETSDPAEITSREHALGVAIRAARSAARQGEIFRPEVARIFRETIRSNFSRRSPKERQAALDALPGNLALKINDSYPPTVPLATVPPTLLRQLPPLPDTLEYRLVGNRLILRDVNANLVVDFITNVVSKPPA